MSMQKIQQKLLHWFEKHKRDLPWRHTKNPYHIWISEVMLQQTTTTAVIPYYLQFLKKFPNIQKLSQAQTKEVFSLWAGLGYYKRAENLIQAAKQIHKLKKFPKSYKELIHLPGFGPYTSRSVSSLAFNKPVGVLDGNVIRVLSRFYGTAFKWWMTSDKTKLQTLADQWVQKTNSSLMNQALMELGSLVCLSKKPICLICPLEKNCKAFQQNTQHLLPLKKPKKAKEFWHWKVKVSSKNSKFAFIKNHKLPFLKNKIIFPGTIKHIRYKPKTYDFSHSIMHYQIFINIQCTNKINSKASLQWFTKTQAQALNPSSLILKVLNRYVQKSHFL